MKKIHLISIFTLILQTFFTAQKSMAQENANYKRFYLNAGLGFSKPLKNSLEFETDDEATKKKHKSKADVKGCGTYQFAVGYFVTPKIGIDLSYDINPSHSVKVTLAKDIGGGSTNTKLRIQNFLINTRYDMQEIKGGITPFFVAGIGIARVGIKQSDYVNVNMQTPAGDIKFPIFQVKKNNSNALSVQLGLGFKKYVNDTVGFSLSASTNIIPCTKIKILKFNTLTQKPEDKTLEKAFGTFNIRAGLTFAF